ncbi:hypothetical protein OYT1_ch2289 [Ferriphaselus amnicola]|uniref:Uncharacterized protein n=1 Tax=Ferriphaselus amnicola TaxID=1188319 RepID=A0A2Z6GF85_9PROT|nr:hypothetical protein [Ferriphaselus amnicola]BBE51805.1 hypothetical protein OYT1_ch2289 [Ferriphaselus amnicola]
MNYFEEATLRLKQQLKKQTDKEVAELLGLSQRAWTGRRQRESFPEKELWALVAQRPDLKLDVDYILNGDSSLIEIIDRFLDYCGLNSTEADEKLGLKPGTVAKALSFKLEAEPKGK